MIMRIWIQRISKEETNKEIIDHNTNSEQPDPTDRKTCFRSRRREAGTTSTLIVNPTNFRTFYAQGIQGRLVTPFSLLLP